MKQDKTHMPEFSQLSGPATNTRQLLLVPAAAKTEISAVYSTTILVDIAPEPIVSTSGISDLLYLESQKHLKKKISIWTLFELSQVTNPIEIIKIIIWHFYSNIRRRSSITSLHTRTSARAPFSSQLHEIGDLHLPGSVATLLSLPFPIRAMNPPGK